MSIVEDRLAIHDLFVRYTTALDAGDIETIVGCFTEDGSLESPAVGSYLGRPAIRDKQAAMPSILIPLLAP